MSKIVSLDRALCLHPIDIAALFQGHSIAVIPNISIQEGWTFALCPCADLESCTLLKQKYHQRFISQAETAILQWRSKPAQIAVWAKCERCKLLYDVEQIEILSSLTYWTKEFLAQLLIEKKHIFLAFLRVYKFPELIEVSQDYIPTEKIGRFVGLPILGEQLAQPVKITQLTPVLEEAIFNSRKVQLEELRSPLHPELEELHGAITQLSSMCKTAQILAQDISAFLGWSSLADHNSQVDPDLLWIKTIADTGNSSNGHDFEKLTRKALIKLGFSNSRNNSKASLDPEATGGAGGIDFFCDAPFLVVGECKATQSENVPSKTPGQLLQLGKNHLQDDYDACIKIIFAAGDLTTDAKLTAESHQMNVIRPETLQKLVELKAKHPGAIDLLDLKPVLEVSPFGEEADDKLNQYIDRVWQKLKFRAALVKAVKHLTDSNKTQHQVVEISTCYRLLFAQQSGGNLDDVSVYEMLKELSSPLVGFLGRIDVGSINSDRFYFLRDFHPDNPS
jgi:hypothetical protein